MKKQCDFCQKDFEEDQLTTVGLGLVCARCLSEQTQPAPKPEAGVGDNDSWTEPDPPSEPRIVNPGLDLNSLNNAPWPGELREALDRNTKALTRLADVMETRIKG